MINEDYMMNASKFTGQLKLTDEELIQAINGTKLILAYARGRLDYFGLLITVLITNLEQLKNFARNRGLNV